MPFERDGNWIRGPAAVSRRWSPQEQVPSQARGPLAIEVGCGPRTGAPLEVTIHDVRGRLIRSLGVPGRVARGGVLPWDGTDGRGVRVAAGNFARVRGCDPGTVRRLVVVR